MWKILRNPFFLILLIWIVTLSCKTSDISLSEIDSATKIDKLKSTYYLNDKNVSIDFSNEENSINIIGFGKVLPNDKTEITQIIYRNTKINFLEIIQVDSDFLIKKIQVLTPESNREVRFSSYKLQEKFVTVEVINLTTNKSLIKKEINLTSEAISLLSSLQTSNKKLAGARIVNQECNIVAGSFKTFFTSTECLTGTLLVPARDETCNITNAATPSKISEWLFPCNRTGADFFNKGKEFACNLKDYYFDNEVLPCLPDRDKDLDDFNACLESAIRPPVTQNEAWAKTNQCFDDYNKKKKGKYNIGDYAFGGIIFYTDTTGKQGLVYPRENSFTTSQTPWFPPQPSKIKLSNPKSVDTLIYTGNTNTTKIVNTYGEGNYAAKLCRSFSVDGYSDWYLPSKQELRQLLINKKLLPYYPVGDLWTSSSNFKFTTSNCDLFSECGYAQVWVINFDNGDNQFFIKNDSYGKYLGSTSDGFYQYTSKYIPIRKFHVNDPIPPK